MQPACKSTMIAGQNLVLPQGLDKKLLWLSFEEVIPHNETSLTFINYYNLLSMCRNKEAVLVA